MLALPSHLAVNPPQLTPLHQFHRGDPCPHTQPFGRKSIHKKAQPQAAQSKMHHTHGLVLFRHFVQNSHRRRLTPCRSFIHPPPTKRCCCRSTSCVQGPAIVVHHEPPPDEQDRRDGDGAQGRASCFLIHVQVSDIKVEIADSFHQSEHHLPHNLCDGRRQRTIQQYIACYPPPHVRYKPAWHGMAAKGGLRQPSHQLGHICVDVGRSWCAFLWNSWLNFVTHESMACLCYLLVLFILCVCHSSSRPRQAPTHSLAIDSLSLKR